jgi:hypothetical protein
MVNGTQSDVLLQPAVVMLNWSLLEMIIFLSLESRFMLLETHQLHMVLVHNQLLEEESPQLLLSEEEPDQPESEESPAQLPLLSEVEEEAA